MDEPLCFVHFINASTCFHTESGGCCSGEGQQKRLEGALLSQPLFPGKGSGKSMGLSLWALRGLILSQRSLGWPNFKHLLFEETEEDIFWEGTTAQGNFCCETGTCLSDFLNPGPDLEIGSDR